MARIPRPTKLKILNGEPNQDRINKNEPQPVTGKTTCPASLHGPARSEWRRIYPILEGMQIVTPADRAALAVYCIAWGTLVDVQNRINQLQEAAVKEKNSPSAAYLLKNGFGNLMVSPLMAIRHRSMEQINTFAAKFGLTPADRGRISLPEKQTEDELDKLLNTGKMN